MCDSQVRGCQLAWYHERNAQLMLDQVSPVVTCGLWTTYKPSSSRMNSALRTGRKTAKVAAASSVAKMRVRRFRAGRSITDGIFADAPVNGNEDVAGVLK